MPVILPINNVCNQNCLFCSAKGRKDNIDSKSIYNSIDQEKELVVISGGEPTLSKDLFRIIRYVKKRDLNIELQTNGVTLSYFTLAKELVEAKIDLFNINFPSHLKELNDKITQTDSFFDKRVKGFQNLQKLTANIRITHIINSLTYRYLPEFIDYVKRKFENINYVQFSFIKIMGNARKNTWIIPRYEEVKEPLLKTLKKCQNYKIDFLIDHIPICYLQGFEEHHVDFIKLKSGQSSEFSLKEKVKLRKCHKCKFNSCCYGVRKDYIELFKMNNILL